MSKLEDKTRQLEILREFLEALAKDLWVPGSVKDHASRALKKWPKEKEG